MKLINKNKLDINKLKQYLDNKFDSYKYGYIYNGKHVILDRNKETEFWKGAYKHYIVPETNIFEKEKVGMCFDVVESIEKYLNSLGIETHKWFSCLPDGNHPHCVITFEANGKVIKADYTPKIDPQYTGERIKEFSNIEEFKDVRIKKGKLIFEYTDKLAGTKLKDLVKLLTKGKLVDPMTLKENNILMLYIDDIILTENMTEDLFFKQVLDTNGYKTTDNNLRILKDRISNKTIILTTKD